MARMRMRKAHLKNILEEDSWQEHLPEIAALNGKEAVAPLMSFLLYGGDMTARAAVALGLVVSGIAQQQMEAGRVLIRRFMWHMNEESGNIGWGIPEAFAEALASSRPLAQEFHKVLISYIVDTGRDDNFCDHAVLRRSCYWAVGRLGQAWPDLGVAARGWLVRGLDDEDIACRGMAAWALSQLPPDFTVIPPLRRLESAGYEERCFIFDGERVREYTVTQLAAQALQQG